MSHPLSTTRTVAVIGAGAMGSGIAQVAAAAGHRVKLYDAREGAARQACDTIAGTFKKLAAKGRMSEADADSASSRLVAIDSLTETSDAGLVVEAIVENLDAKRGLFGQLESIVGDDCILATNTSSISVTAIGAGLKNPTRLVGMHFFNPVPLMALVEVISGLATDDKLADIVCATASAWGKSPVKAKSTPGFIVNRVARPFYAEGLRLLNEQAAEPATIDAIMREAGGFRMGPFELMDLIGHDVNFAVTQSVFNAYYNDPRFTPSIIQQELVNAGFLGRKSGRGFYRYGENSAPPVAHAEDKMPFAGNVTVNAANPFAEQLIARFEAAGIDAACQQLSGPHNLLLRAGAASVYLTDGRSATEQAAETGVPHTVLIDLAGDYAKAARVALCCADQCSQGAWHDAVGLFQAAGFQVSRLRDVPGMAVMRTVAMLANEAADAVNQGVCSAQAADVAMQKGVNYPKGPLAWADAIGLRHVMTVLANLAQSYGEDRYRVSPLIRRKVASGARFYE